MQRWKKEKLWRGRFSSEKTNWANRTKELSHQHIKYHYESRWYEIVSIRNWKDNENKRRRRKKMQWQQSLKCHYTCACIIQRTTTASPKKKTFRQQTFTLLIQPTGIYNIRIKSIAFTFSTRNWFEIASSVCMRKKFHSNTFTWDRVWNSFATQRQSF